MKHEQSRVLASLVVGLALAGLPHVFGADDPVVKPEQAVESNGPAPYRIMGGETVKLIVPAAVGESLVETIFDDGLVSLPTGSTINVRGKTLAEAQALINKRLAEDSSLRQVSAVLVVTQFPPRKIYINGDVKVPQALTVLPGTETSLTAVLTAVGGAMPQADLSRVNIVRTTPEGKREATVVDATRFGTPGNTDLGPVLQAGDVVTVPRGSVYVLAGEVTKPGIVNRNELFLSPGESPRISRVLFASGGLRASANRRTLRIIRRSKSGQQTIIPVDLEAAIQPINPTYLASADGATVDSKDSKNVLDNDPVLQDGDMIVAGGTGGVIVLGKVRAPGLYPITGGKLKLSHAIAQAGGFAEFAKTSGVTVTHAGSHSSMKVDVGSIIKDGQMDRDVDLEDGDVVFVGGGVL
jgi:protein involved in polysaccharide export with SLBB domain